MHGCDNEALELIRRCWGGMLDKGAETFWEFTPNNESDRWLLTAHAWSTGCTYLLSAYVLGIRMTKPEFNAIVFEPKPCDLVEMSGVVPTSNGLIAASYKLIDGIKHFRISIPKGIEVEYKLPENSVIKITEY